MCVPGCGTPWFHEYVWCKDDHGMGLPVAYQPILLRLGWLWCWVLDRHLAGPGGLCARGCGRHDPDDSRRKEEAES